MVVHSRVYPIDRFKEKKNIFATLAAHEEDKPRRMALLPDSTNRWSPQITLFEDNLVFQVEALISGLDPSKISVTIEGKNLVFSGEKSAITDTGNEDGASSRISAQRFVKKVRMPLAADIRRMRIDYNEDSLVITTPKAHCRVA